MKIPSVMNHNFSQVPHASIPRSQFDLSFGHKTTFNAGLLIPILLQEALPGDTFSLNVTAFARLATPLFPIMDNMYMDTFFFAVPNRLVWDNWERFNGAQDNPGDSTDYVIPTVNVSAAMVSGSIYDYFGLPVNVFDGQFNFNALPLRAYNLIWNEWFRDQNLQDSLDVLTNDGPDDPLEYVLKNRGKRHDYFTSSLPWPQKGPAVTIPLGTSAPVWGTGKALTLYDNSGGGIGDLTENIGTYFNAYTGLLQSNVGTAASGTALNASHVSVGVIPPGFGADASGLVADLTDATAATINQLREAFQVQKLYERDARGGTRYTEILRAHFGVTSPDARLQRPEYLGGGSTPIIINPVAQTSSTSGQPSPQGNLAAVGTCSIRGHGFTKSFVEHSYVIGLVSVRADLTYQQGLNRLWSRSTRFDFYWPALSHIGEQAVLNQEIYAQGLQQLDGSGNPYDLDVFGYQERFAEYRYRPSMVTGQFRSSDAASLDAWHLAQDFGSLPTLSDSFIQESPPVDRILAVPSADEGYSQFLFDSYFNFKAARPMPTYSVPGLIDHF